MSRSGGVFVQTWLDGVCGESRLLPGRSIQQLCDVPVGPMKGK